MIPTLVRCSKASRAPLTGKRANKDYYKGTRQAFLPGGHRTGAPGRHVIGGRAKYRLIDEQVRVYVAPPISDIISSPLRPYVSRKVNLTKEEERLPYGRFRGPEGLTAEHFLRVSQQRDQIATAGVEALGPRPPSWYNAQVKLSQKGSKTSAVPAAKTAAVEPATASA